MLYIPSEASPASLALASEVGLNLYYPLTIRQWKAYAIEQFPKEAVALILKDGSLVPVENLHEDPNDHFEFDLAVLAYYGDSVAGLVHSHTPGWKGDPSVKPSAEPSEADMASQIATAIPWGISTCSADSVSDPIWWGDSLSIRPLLGRQFVHGIMDCYSLVRDFHRLNGITFEDVPRDSDWWTQDKDLYMELFESRGFERVQRVAPKAGDCFICSLRSDKRNHAGVFISDDLFIHHPGDSLSVRSQANRWRQKLDFLVRHKDLPEE